MVSGVRASKVRVHTVAWLQRRVQWRDHASLASFVLWTQTKCQRYLREYLLPYVCLYGLKFARHSVLKLTGIRKFQKTISPFHPQIAAKTIVVLCTTQLEKTIRISVNANVQGPFLSTRSSTGLALAMWKQETFSVSNLIYYFSNSKSLYKFTPFPASLQTMILGN